MTNKERAQALRECLKASRDRLLAKGWEAMTPQELMRRARGKFPDTDGETRFFGLPDDVRVATIKRLAVDRSYFISDTYLRQLTRADYQNVRGDVARFSAHFVLALRRHRLPFYVHEAFRTPDRQAELVAQGRSRAIPPIAPHVQGCAVDVVHSRFGWQLTRTEWSAIGKIGQSVADKLNIPMEWGGTWSFYDPAHWQLRDWKDHARAEVRIGERLTATPSYISRNW